MSSALKTNKENFRLLDLSSDEESEDLQLEIIPRKKKITRRERSRNAAVRTPEPGIRAEIQTAVRWAVRSTLFLWLLSLSWAAVVLYEQISAMRGDIVRVSTSSNGVGDALQLCHTAAKELKANASYLSARLDALELLHQELTKRVEQESGQLKAVSDQLSAAPKLADTPRRLAELQRTVADFGSQISGFDSTLKSAHKQALAASTSVDEVKTALHDLELRTNETAANVTALGTRADGITALVASVNGTIAARVDALSTRIEEALRTTTTAAPTTTSPSTVRNTNAPATSTTTTTTLPPGPPAKPSVTVKK